MSSTRVSVSTRVSECWETPVGRPCINHWPNASCTLSSCTPRLHVSSGDAQRNRKHTSQPRGCIIFSCLRRHAVLQGSNPALSCRQPSFIDHAKQTASYVCMIGCRRLQFPALSQSLHTRQACDYSVPFVAQGCPYLRLGLRGTLAVYSRARQVRVITSCVLCAYFRCVFVHSVAQ